MIILIRSLTGACQTPDCPAEQPSNIYNEVQQDIDYSHQKGWEMIDQFSDEFEGNHPFPDSEKWWYDWGDDYCYSRLRLKGDLMPVVNGKLRMCVRETEPFVCEGNIYHYETGGMTSSTKFHYGYVETLVTFPSDPNFRFEFWLYTNTNSIYYDEIDRIEFGVLDNHPMIFTHSLHCDDHIEGKTQLNVCCHDTLNEYHMNKRYLFAVEWLPKEVHWYINGEIVFSKKLTDNLSYIYPHNEFACSQYVSHPQVIVISNSWIYGPENRDPSQFYEIDYVRSYKLKPGIPAYWPRAFSYYDEMLFRVNGSVHMGDREIPFIVDNYEKYTVWATDSIVMGKGFSTDKGAKFTARVIKTDPDLFEQPEYKDPGNRILNKHQ